MLNQKQKDFMNILSVCLLASAMAFTFATESIKHLAPVDVKRTNTTLAADQLYVGGVDLLSQSDYKVERTTGYAQLSGNTLTLNNFTYNGAGYTYIDNTTPATYRGGIMCFGTEDLKINVEGDNVTNKEIADATYLLKKAYQNAELDSRDIIKDEETGVQVKTNDGTGIPTDVNLKVELKTDVKAEEASVEYSKIQEKVGNDYQISNVFEIKLIKTENGVEREIQPSEIKEGMKLIITMDLPEDLDTKGLKLLHIHNNGESEYVDEFTIENGKVTFEVSSLSEIALVTPKNNLNVITILIIVILSILLLLAGIWLLMMFATNQWIKDDKDKARRACKFFGIKNKKDEFVVLSFPFKFVGRNEDEIFDNKEDAEK